MVMGNVVTSVRAKFDCGRLHYCKVFSLILLSYNCSGNS